MARVLMIVENQSAPTDRRVWQSACALTGAGHQVVVVSPTGRDRDTEGEATIDGVHIHRYRPAPELRGLWQHPVEFGWAIVRSFALALRLDRTYRFDIVHICNPPDLLFLVALPLKRRGAAIVFDHHDPSPELFQARFGESRFFGWALRTLERATFRTADHVLTTNQRMAALARDRGRVPPDKLTVVPNGPMLAHTAPRPAEPRLRQGRAKLVCYLGIIGPHDGVDLLVHAMWHVRYRLGRTDVTTVVIGDGDARPAAEDLARDVGVDECVLFTGFLPWDELTPYLATADVCVSPDSDCPYNRVVTQNKILDYMGMGRPIVTFDLPSARDIAGPSALYAPPDDVAAMAELIDRLLDDPADAGRRGRLARERFERDLAWEHVEPRLLEAYATIVSRTSRDADGLR